MKNAKAKGVKIGRVRKRNDALIHSLLEAGLSFRECARVAKCSHGSISASKKEWLAKKAEAAKLEDSKKEIVVQGEERINIEIAPPVENMIFETFD